jgi:hypothetical protein
MLEGRHGNGYGNAAGEQDEKKIRHRDVLSFFMQLSEK